MRLTTWNVNGIRNPFSYPPWNASRSFSSMFDILESDIVVMQELKIQRKDLRDDMVLVDGWDCYFSLPKHKKGYSGVGIYTRNSSCAPVRAEEGLLGVLPSANGTPYRDLPEDDTIGGYPTPSQVAELDVDPAALDAEGRCVIVEFPAFVLFGVYSPANSNGLRDDFRYGFIRAMDCRIRNLIREGKNVVLVGDLNVTRHEIDSAATLEEIRKNAITREEYLSGPNRRIFNQMLIGGEILSERDAGREQGVLWDTTRAFHPDRRGMYTHWETKINARPGNYGSRIDFVLVSENMQKWIRDANIQEGLLGSDHCPVFVDFHNVLQSQEEEINFLDIMNPAGFFRAGDRKTEWSIASTPAFSAKRMPEFDKRRSIKTMFAAPALRKVQSSAHTINSGADAPKPPDDKIPSVTQQHSATSGSTSIDEYRRQSTPKLSLSPIKRKASTAKEQLSKRQKSEANPAVGKGQQSLKGFFQAKNSPDTNKERESESLVSKSFAGGDDSVSVIEDHHAVGQLDLEQAAIKNTTANSGLPETLPETPMSTQASIARSPSPSPSQVASQVASAEESQKSWGALFARPVAPMCEHDEPCKTMQTKKKGSNQGRSFWMCARPLGPSGEKERGTQWRCSTFIWCSDWVPRKDGGKLESPVK